MNIPGFTAEDSLHKTSSRYKSVITRIGDNVEQRVIPQIGVGGNVGSVGLGFDCGPAGCSCTGDDDCTLMFEKVACGPGSYCYWGWVIEEWVCICTY